MSTATDSKNAPSSDMASFRAHLGRSTRVLALLGAGLSAASGLPTFRGAGGLWRDRAATDLATPDAFDDEPGLVWQFYAYRRHMALKAQPNRAHKALAELARRVPGFVTLSQNVDGLSPRAGHPREQLHLLHGSLFDITCSWERCGYVDRDNFEDPLVPALAIPTAGEPALAAGVDGAGAADNMMTAMRQQAAGDAGGQELDISDAATPLKGVPEAELPKCPQCKEHLLRPGVVWFGEALPPDTLAAVEAFVQAGPIDLILVIGTSAQVYPAAGYVEVAKRRGARVAVVNMDRADTPGGAGGLDSRDWFFEGDASALVPEMLAGVVGRVG